MISQMHGVSVEVQAFSQTEDFQSITATLQVQDFSQPEEVQFILEDVEVQVLSLVFVD